MLTPVERVNGIWLKRDDLWNENNIAYGGKARVVGEICRHLVSNHIPGAVVSLDYHSSIAGMLSRLYGHYRLALHIFVPEANRPLPPTFAEAEQRGVVIHRVPYGYMTVRRKHAEQFAKDRGFAVLGMGSYLEGIGDEGTTLQVQNIPEEVERVIVPVGSGNMLRGISAGIERFFDGSILTLGIYVKNRPQREYPPFVALVPAGIKFGKERIVVIGNVVLDPVFEAHCQPFLKPNDLLWVVAHRSTE